MSKNKKHVIDLFEENELNIGELYKIYSQRIPDNKKFWSELSDEEFGHAKNIRDACGGDEKKKELLSENKFCRFTIKYVSRFVEKETKKAKKGNISHVKALNTALRIEQSILEKKCFELFAPADPTVKKVLKKLNKEVERHAELLMEEIKNLDQ